MTPEAQRQLLARACADDLSPDEAARLLDACRRDAALLGELSRLMLVERLLAHAHVYADDAAFVREVRARLADETVAGAEPPGARRAWRTPWGWAAAAAIMIGTVVSWTTLSRPPEARIVRIESAAWDASQAAPRIGETLDSRRLQLESGLVELKFARGATVIVEGPADFEVLGPQHAFLHRGRAVTRMAPGTQGFILDSPRGRLVDQGTEFGVNVGATGDTEVHVLEGKVEAVPSNRQQTVQLSANEAARFMSQRVERFAADPIGFITDLPPPPAGAIGFLHWSFDEAGGTTSTNRGAGLGAPRARAIAHTFPAGGTGPQWISGQFGAGVLFDGRDDFVECEFPGIAGTEPRTVAFWVKVPRDSTVDEGYGIMNWGTMKPGLAWQISVNPNASEGPLGRLRLGVHDGWVVGTTDLRDDRWHHCAVVMYGGHRPDSATHVLLYLDGELEPAARKAVREIRTQVTGDEAHNMWLGRNLGYRGDDRYKLGRFFRGGVDEVFVFNASLNQEQIRSLMKFNRLEPPARPLAQHAPP